MYTRAANATSPTMAARVRAAARIGCHHDVAPRAMRPGIANGAVAGKYDASWAQLPSGSPVTAISDAKYENSRRVVTGAAMLDASSVRDASDPNAP